MYTYMHAGVFYEVLWVNADWYPPHVATVASYSYNMFLHVYTDQAHQHLQIVFSVNIH